MSRPTASPALLDRLPAAAQQRLRIIGKDALNLIGELRDFQRAFDRHLDVFDALIADGTSHEVIGLLLAEVGVRRSDGRPLSRGTVSSALGRARERAAARTARARPAPRTQAAPQAAASSGSALQQPAEFARPRQAPAGRRRGRPSAATSDRGEADNGAASPPVAAPAQAPAAGAEPSAIALPENSTAARNLRAGSLVNQLRRSNDPCR